MGKLFAGIVTTVVGGLAIGQFDWHSRSRGGPRAGYIFSLSVSIGPTACYHPHNRPSSAPEDQLPGKSYDRWGRGWRPCIDQTNTTHKFCIPCLIPAHTATQLRAFQ